MKSLLILALITTACGSASSGDKVTGTNTEQGSSITFEKTTPPARPLPDEEGYAVQTESTESCLSWGGLQKCEARFTPAMNCQSALIKLQIHDGQAWWWVETTRTMVAGEYLIVRFDESVRGKLNDYYSVQSQTSVKCQD